MSNLTNTNKINYLFKKSFGKPTTILEPELLQEPNIIFSNNISSYPSLFSHKYLYRDPIPDEVPIDLINSILDDSNNNLIGSIVGKTSNDGSIKKFNKIPLQYVYGSKNTDENENILSISFYSKLLEKSIPYNYDPNGTYAYELFRYDGITEINYSEGDWILDNDTGILTFFSTINFNIENSLYVTPETPPKISFYKYNSAIGLYPISFTINNNVEIKSNLKVEESAVFQKNVNINNHLNLNDIIFKKQDDLPTNTVNQLVYFEDSLYFNNETDWIKLNGGGGGNSGGTDGSDIVLYNNEQFVFNNSISHNILNINTNISIIELTETLTNDIYIILPIVQSTGVEKTIIMGQSVSEYINNYNVILYSKYIDTDGSGPIYMNIKFITTGQSVKLMSIASNTENVYGTGNFYWQVISGNFHSNDTFEYIDGVLVNTNDSGVSYQPNVNNTEYQTFVATESRKYVNSLVNTLMLNITGINTVSESETTIIQCNTTLISNVTIQLDLPTTVGIKKNILMGNSFENFKNGKFILINSTFMGGYNTEFLTTVSNTHSIKFIKSGQSIQMISMKTTANNYYWHIMFGDFEFL